MTAPKPNAELAYRVLDHIDADPDSWNQGTWSCGTAACFGGRAVQLSGGEIHIETFAPDFVTSGPPEIAGLDVELAALKVLGLKTAWIERGDEDEWLFSASNDREDLGRLVEELFGPRPERAS